MNWNNFLTYNDSYQNAFETLCNQLFERYLKRNFQDSLTKFRVINGSGGDGGIEAYGELESGEIKAVQAKWFRQAISKNELRQINKSIRTAKSLRPQITEYIICIPHNVWSLKYGRGKSGEQKKPIDKFEEKVIEEFNIDINQEYPDLKITWWFEKDLESELQQSENEGVLKFWFDKEIIPIKELQNIFSQQKEGWLHSRYVPELHGQGLINKEYQSLTFSSGFRESLLRQINEVSKDIEVCIKLIDKFNQTNQNLSLLNLRLLVLKRNFLEFLEIIRKLKDAVATGNDLYRSPCLKEVWIGYTMFKLEKIKPNNLQKSILPKLIKGLQRIHQTHVPQFVESISQSFNKRILLIAGDAGTGKTHGLVNCVERHLESNSPAVIIQAKAIGKSSKSWTDILSEALELKGWRKDEILSALESLATRNDLRRASSLNEGQELAEESTKVLICIDGLEEDQGNDENWFTRIRECESITAHYPRVRFIFSARKYFYSYKEIPEKDIFESLILPREGDVPIEEIAERYFNKENYNIELASYDLIRGIDNLFALRLFCEQYRNQIIKETDKIVTATQKLLIKKINKVNREFLSTLENKQGSVRNPIITALEVVANHFYTNTEINHNELLGLILPLLNSYLTGSEIDLLIDFLTKNGFLIRSERVNKDSFLEEKEHYYNVTYQSLIEHVISGKIYHDIKSGRLNRIPQFLHEVMIQPLDYSPKESREHSMFSPPNWKIIQNIVNNLLHETGQLIGDGGFLSEGFNTQEVFELQMEALISAPKGIAEKYKGWVDEKFYRGGYEQYLVFKHLILPSCESIERYFGAEYLHKILVNQPSAFKRDQLWSGPDTYEKNHSDLKGKFYNSHKSIAYAFDETGNQRLSLSGWYLHNEKPLVYAWGLSSINQRLRSKLRVALTEWAIKSPPEFLLLLKKMFLSNDPQIQEDLASIMLGVASKLKDKANIKALAVWTLDNIFSQLHDNRNVTVRQGFRAIVEKAYHFGEISSKEVERAKPHPCKEIILLRLNDELLRDSSEAKEQVYPILQDLSWYVINKAYDYFLELPTLLEAGVKDNDCNEASQLLEKYRVTYNEKDLFAHRWAMAAAIEYIRGLGFDRKEGNSFTDATHGAKSEVFTYEEKYTWLAVHYLQGYLSDYIPVKKWSGEREFIRDYSILTDIPNPAEFIVDVKASNIYLKAKGQWVVKDILSKEIDQSQGISSGLSTWVSEEPDLKFNNWLEFDTTDFIDGSPNNKWRALYNHTTLHDSKSIGYTYIDVRACLVKEKDFSFLKRKMADVPDEFQFIGRLNEFRATPRTSTYCNPSDIAWMTWIEEDGESAVIYDEGAGEEKKIFYTITQVVQKDLDKEDYIMLPSKLVRNLIGAHDLEKTELRNANGNTVAFIHKVSDNALRDRQEMVLVDLELFNKELEKDGLRLCWFVELFKQKNPLNKEIQNGFHIRRSRKYFVWSEGNGYDSYKYGDEELSNLKDEQELGMR